VGWLPASIAVYQTAWAAVGARTFLASRVRVSLEDQLPGPLGLQPAAVETAATPAWQPAQDKILNHL